MIVSDRQQAVALPHDAIRWSDSVTLIFCRRDRLTALSGEKTSWPQPYARPALAFGPNGCAKSFRFVYRPVHEQL